IDVMDASVAPERVNTGSSRRVGRWRAGIAVAAGSAVVGALLFWGWRTHSLRPAMQSAPASSQPPTALSPSILAAAASPALASSGVAAAAPPIPRDPIELLVTPGDATISVDGRLLPPGVHAVARPPSGASSRVVVTARRFQSKSLVVDHAAPDQLVVALAS